MTKKKFDIWENKVNSLPLRRILKERTLERAQAMVYTMLQVTFDIAKKEIMEGDTEDEMAIIALERIVSTLKESSLTSEQAGKIMKLVKGETKLEDE